VKSRISDAEKEFASSELRFAQENWDQAESKLRARMRTA